MSSRNFFAELKRRNIYRVAVAYAVVAWLLVQIATQTFPFFEIPNWAVRLVILLIALGFPVALILAWAFELTPEGIKRTEDVLPNESITRRTGRHLTALVAIITAVALALFLVRQIARPRSAASEEKHLASLVSATNIPDKSIAVLPFANMSDDQQNAWFADGMQDEILTDLAKIADLKVISRTSVMQYKAGARNIREIGQQLGVAHILEGSVQRSRDKVRVTAQLINAHTDEHQWADHFDRPLDDVFAIQSEIATAIAGQLRAKILPNEKVAIDRPPTDDVEAFDLYTRGKTLLFGTVFSFQIKENLLQAIELFNQAIARDPEFCLAYCQLAAANDQLYFLGRDHSPARLALAEAAVQKALQLRPDAGEAHLALAQHRYRGYLDYAGARKELAIARKTLPNDPLPFEIAGYIERRSGNWEQSTRDLENALKLDPRNVFTLQQISASYFFLRRYSEMAGVLDRALTIVPKDVDTRIVRASLELDWHADTKPLRTMVDTLLKENPSAAAKFADSWLTLALCEKNPDDAQRALTALGTNNFGSDAVQFSQAFGQALIAHLRKDSNAEHAAFAEARAQQEKVVAAQPDYGPALCVLALIDAGLGKKDDAMREGKKAMELLPVAKDSINGAHMIEYFGVICAWLGEKNLALENAASAAKIPGSLSYGQVELYPFWEALRGDPRFEKIANSLKR